jgi:hypothetical protein
MPKYRGYGMVEGSKYLGVVEAKDELEALKKFRKGASVTLCHACADECEDGEVTEIQIVESKPEDGEK